MRTYRAFVCDFPADDFGAMAGRVCEAVPRRFWPHFDFLPYGGYRLILPIESAALLRLFIDGVEVAGPHRPFLAAGELFVPDRLKFACERWLASQRRGPAKWSELYQLDVWDEGARAAFHDRYQLALLALRAGRAA
jgi:hypothetical protein